MYQKCHAAIRADPTPAAKKDRGYTGKAPLFRQTKRSLAQKMDKAKQKIQAAQRSSEE